MKANIKYTDPYVTTKFKELKKEYEIYKNLNGFYVINVLDIEVPIFNQKTQSFDLFYKVKKADENIIIPDRNGFYKIELIIALDQEALDVLNNTKSKKSKK